MDHGKGWGRAAGAVALGLLSLLLAPSALAGSHTEDAAEAPVVHVEVHNWAFQPEVVEAPRGAVLVVMNQDPWDHLILADDSDTAIRVRAGESVEIPLPNEGVLALQCAHYLRGGEGGGMRAMVRIVSSGAALTQPGQAPTLTAENGRRLEAPLQAIGLAGPLAALACLAWRAREGQARDAKQDRRVRFAVAGRIRPPRRDVRFVPVAADAGVSE